MTTKVNGSVGVEFPDSSVQASAAYTKAESNQQEAFSAVSDADQSLTTGVATKLLFQSELLDANASYDTTNSRYTPKIAGYYQVNAQMYLGNTAAALAQVQIRKNGAFVQEARGLVNASFAMTISISGLVFLNGTTDYLEIYGQQNTGANLNVITPNTVFSAALVGRF